MPSWWTRRLFSGTLVALTTSCVWAHPPSVGISSYGISGAGIAAPRIARWGSTERIAQNASEVGSACDRLEQLLTGSDLEESNSAVADLRRKVSEVGFASLDAASQSRVRRLRLEAGKRGCEVGPANYWGFDGLVFDSGKDALVKAIEDKAYNVERLISNSESDRAGEELSEYRKALQRPELQSDAALKVYFENIAASRLASILARLAHLRLYNMENEYTWVLEGVKQNNLVNADIHAPRFKQKYYRLRHDGFDTGALKIHKKAGDPLSEEISLDVALKDVNGAMLALKAIAEKEKAKQAAYEREWKTVLRGDQARIYAQNGIPTRFDGCLPDYRAGAAAKSSWWLYYHHVDKFWMDETTYRFDGSGRLLSTEKHRSFFPQR